MKDFKNKVVVITGGATGIGFGLEFDYYDNYEDIRIEHLIEDLKTQGVKVSWSNPNDNYLDL